MDACAVHGAAADVFTVETAAETRGPGNATMAPGGLAVYSDIALNPDGRTIYLATDPSGPYR